MSIHDKLAALECSSKSLEEYCRENHAQPMGESKITLERPMANPPLNEYAVYLDNVQLDAEKILTLLHNGLIAIAACERTEGYAKIGDFGKVWVERFTGHPVKFYKKPQMIDYSGMSLPD